MSGLIWSPFENIEQARSIARLLLHERLVACANFHEGMESMFQWNGVICEATECGVLFKTDASLLEPAIRRLEELHPYQTPAIVGWICESAGAATQTWLGELKGGGVDGDIIEA